MSGRWPLGATVVLICLLPAAAIPGDLVITDADDASNRGPITEVGGDLIIRDTTLRSVRSLLSLTTVEGKLEIRNNSRVKNLDWLPVLQIVKGRVIIGGNSALDSLDGLKNLSQSTSLEIFDNPSLVTVDGFKQLKLVSCTLAFVNNSALAYVGGFPKLVGVPTNTDEVAHECRDRGMDGPMIAFRNNRVLSDVGGFESVNSHTLQLIGNRALKEVSGFRNLRHIQGGLEIVENDALDSLPLSQLRTVAGYLQICNNAALQTLDLRIRSIEGARFMLSGSRAAFALQVANNSGLRKLTFRSIRLIDGAIDISGNGALQSVLGLKTLTVGGKMSIERNALLRNISLQLISVQGSFNIIDNHALQNLTVVPLWSVMNYLVIGDNSALEYVHMTLGNMKGHMRIFNNAALTHLNFSALNIVYGDLQINTSSVSVWEGFPHLKYVQGHILLTSPAMPLETGKQLSKPVFGHLGSVGGDFTVDHSCVETLRGFDNLAIVRGGVRFLGNSALGSIEGFNSLREVQGQLHIIGNPVLERVDGFDNVVNVGALQITDNPLLSYLEGLWAIRKNCSIWGMPDTYGFTCDVQPAHVILICSITLALFAASFLMTATCKSKYPIAEFTRSGSRLFVRTKKPHCLRPREGGSFFVRLKGTGCSLLDEPGEMLRARVIGSTELELVGLAIEKLMEEASLERAAALGVLSVRLRDELRLIGWPLPLLFWLFLLLVTWFVSSFVVKLDMLDYLRVCGLAVASGALFPAVYRVTDWARRRDRAQQKARAFHEAELMQRLEMAGWEEDMQAKAAIRDELVRAGWTQERFDEHWDDMLRRQSQEAGVSVAYLLSPEFRSLAQQRSGKEDPTFYDLKDAFFLCDDPLGRGKTCPRDGQAGCALTDWLPRGHRRACTHFLSWTWGYTLNQVCGALQQWLEQANLDPERIFLYMCFFVNNQHRIIISGTVSGSDNLETVFESNLKRIGKMVALLDDWNAPLYLSRIWTVFEQFTAVKLGIDVEIIIPPSACCTLVREIHKGEVGIKLVRRSLCRVDSKNAKAWSEQDERKVKQEIQDTIGFEAVNRKVCQFMVAWIAKQVQSHLTSLVLAGTPHRSFSSLGATSPRVAGHSLSDPN